MVINLETVVLISEEVAQDGPVRLALQHPSQFIIWDDYSKMEIKIRKLMNLILILLLIPSYLILPRSSVLHSL